MHAFIIGLFVGIVILILGYRFVDYLYFRGVNKKGFIICVLYGLYYAEEGGYTEHMELAKRYKSYSIAEDTARSKKMQNYYIKEI